MSKKVMAVALLGIASVAGYAQAFELSSPDVPKKGMMPQDSLFNGFGCTGPNISPALHWKNAPAGTKSFAVIMHDPDAPTGVGGFRHWVVVDLPADLSGIPKGASKLNSDTLLGGRQIATDIGATGYVGPCPPTGTASKPHSYQFTVYALKVEKLDLPANASAAVAGFMANMNKLGTATMIGSYGR